MLCLNQSWNLLENAKPVRSDRLESHVQPVKLRQKNGEFFRKTILEKMAYTIVHTTTLDGAFERRSAKMFFITFLQFPRLSCTSL